MNLAPRSATIFVFAKPPIADRAKTRLAADVGAPLATALAKAFLHDLWSIACAIPWADAVLAGTEPDPAAYGLDRSVPIEVQGEGDLGVRMERMLLRGLARSRHAFVVGTDVPGVGIAHFERARDALATHDACLAEAADGGFYLVGLTRHRAGLFDEVPWSVPETFERTRAQMRTVGLSVGVGAPWFDVDDAAGLEHALAHWDDVVARAPRTAAVLREHFAEGQGIDARIAAARDSARSHIRR